MESVFPSSFDSLVDKQHQFLAKHFHHATTPSPLLHAKTGHAKAMTSVLCLGGGVAAHCEPLVSARKGAFAARFSGAHKTHVLLAVGRARVRDVPRTSLSCVPI